MSHLPRPGLGERIAYYRKLNGWSAERLAQESGEGVTRAILAQLESRKRDTLSIAQFMAICLALGVPPAALLADALHPEDRVRDPEINEGRPIATGRLQMWAAGRANIPIDGRTELPSAQKWMRLSDALGAYFADSDDEQLLRRLLRSGQYDEAVRSNMLQSIAENEQRVRRLLEAEDVVLDEEGEPSDGLG